MGKLCKKISDRRGSHSGRDFFRTHCLFLGSPLSGKLNSTGAYHPEEFVPRHIPKLLLQDTAPFCFQKTTYTFRSNVNWYSSLPHFLFFRIMRPQSSGEHKTSQHSYNRAEFPESALFESDVCWTGMTAIMVRLKNNEPPSHPRKSNHPASFQRSPVKSPQPGSVRHRGAFPAAFLKKPGQAWTLVPCWPIGVWNGALYQMKCPDPANCFLALSSCGSSWFYNTQSESLFWRRRVLPAVRNLEVWVLYIQLPSWAVTWRFGVLCLLFEYNQMIYNSFIQGKSSCDDKSQVYPIICFQSEIKESWDKKSVMPAPV